MTTATRPLPDHGTPSRYRGDPRPKKSWTPCRCHLCKTAHRRASKIRDLRKARGIPSTQPVGPIADHVHSLIASGWTMLDIQRESNVDVRGLYNIRHQRQTTVRNATAARLFALQPGRDPFLVDATGTRRRLHALAAAGYSLAWTARQAGMSERGMQEIGRGRWATVMKPTRHAISAVYEQYAHTPGPSSWTRVQAERNGWLDVAFWDDVDRIDDPDFDPASMTEPPKYMRLGEDALWLRDQGYTRHQVADRLGESLDYIDQSVKRYRAAVAEQVAA